MRKRKIKEAPKPDPTAKTMLKLRLSTGEDIDFGLYIEQHHPQISVTNESIWEEYDRYVFIQKQRELNNVRRGFNLVDPERSRHILEGRPISRCVSSNDESEDSPTATVIGWKGGHANPDAAKFGKSQIPDYWTGERFMFEVSDILTDSSSQWYKQEVSEVFPGYNERFVCVEKRYGVPIRVVAERVDDEYRCVTAFPDYEPIELDESLRVDYPTKTDGSSESE